MFAVSPKARLLLGRLLAETREAVLARAVQTEPGQRPDEAPQTPIATHRFDTGNLPVEDQFATWASHSSTSRMTRSGGGPFRARAAFWKLDGLMISEQWLDPFEAERDEALIRAAHADHYLLIVTFEGQTRFRAPGVDQVCEAGDAILSDFTRPSATSSSRQYSATLNIARAFLDEAAGSRDVHGRLPRTPETRLLVDFIRTLVRQLPATAPASVAPVSRIIRDLLATAVCGLPLHSSSAGGALAARLRVKHHIEAQPPGSLDVASLLRELGLTRATLYRLFKPDGGVFAYDRLRRLRQLHRCLSNPLDRRGITELGYAHGFLDPANLAHTFREAFGYSMSALRDHLRIGQEPAVPPGCDIPARYQEVVRSVV